MNENEYFADYLKKLKTPLGLFPKKSPFNLNDIVNLSETEIQKRDDRGFSILMVAAETGHTTAIDNLIERFEDLDLEVDQKTAASIAIEKGQHDIALKLLHANAKIPENYQSETASEELKAFVELSTKMHEKVAEDNEENLNFLTKTIDTNPKLRYFYDINNNSLLKTTLLNKQFTAYELLLLKFIFLAPHESMTEIKKECSLTLKERRKLRDIHKEYANDLMDEEMMILLRNCKISRDNVGDYFEFIRKAFIFLFNIPQAAKIIKVAVKHRDFKFIFDFNRDSVEFLDPDSERYTNGKIYLNGDIFIAAKDMLDPAKLLNVYSIIAHELCHFVMFLVYDNWAKPYIKNTADEESFELITRECEERKSHQEIVSLVFDVYDKDMHHAELIVRVPQMVVAFKNNEILLLEMRKTYLSLFDFYERNVMNQMEQKLQGIEIQHSEIIEENLEELEESDLNSSNVEHLEPEKNQKAKQRDSSYSNSNLDVLTECNSYDVVTSIFNLKTLFIGLAILLVSFSSPTLKWSEMSNEQKSEFKNAKISFYGVNSKFQDIFGSDTVVYDLLTSDQLKYGLSGKSLNLTESVKHLYGQHVYLTWRNMTNDLKNHFLTLNVNFQGELITFKELLTNYSALNCLTTFEILQILNGHPINVSSKPKFIQDFYIEIFFNGEETKVNENHYENDKINQKLPDVKTIEEIIKTFRKTETFLISNHVGAGKSTAFKNLAIKLKETFPKRWIQFLDLKKYFETFEIGKKININDVEELLTNDLLKLNKLEKEIFKDFFSSGRVILLWDEIDDTATLHKDFINKLVGKVSGLQFISTRAQFLNDFSKKFKVKTLNSFWSPTLKWSEMSNIEKSNFRNAKINFYGVNSKFQDIFGSDTVVYDLLSSDQLKYGLSEKSLDLTESVKHLYGEHVYLTWRNMTNDLKNHFLTLNVNFQGELITFKELLTNYSALNCLTTFEILQILNGHPINVSSKPKFIQDFYIERFFIDEETKVNENHENDKINQKLPDVKTIEQIVKTFRETEIFLISNHVGAGKSIAFKNLAIKLKETFPKKWIQFLDLKKYFETFEIGKKININDVEEFLTNDLLKLNKLEKEIFKDFFSSGRVILLWNEVDEIATLHKDFMIELVGKVSGLQFISTRPQFLNDFSKKLKVKTLKLVPFGKSERFEFLTKLIASKLFSLNADQYWHEFNSKEVADKNLREKIFKLVEKCEKILSSIETSKLRDQFLTNPLLIKMIVEILSLENFENLKCEIIARDFENILEIMELTPKLFCDHISREQLNERFFMLKLFYFLLTSLALILLFYVVRLRAIILKC